MNIYKYFVKFVLCFILLQLSFQISAQSVGFMGKKFMVMYDFSYRPSVFDYYGESDDSFLRKAQQAIKTKHELGFEYVLKRNLSLRPFYAYSFFRYGENRQDFQQVGFDFRKYTMNRMPIAPIGIYYSLRVHSTLMPDKNINKNLILAGVNLTFGRQSVVFKKWILDTGMIIGFTTPVNAKKVYGSDYDFSYVFHGNEIVAFLNEIVAFRIGLGLPLF